MPLNIAFWLAAFFPIAFLLGTMTGLNWKSTKAAPCAVVLAACVAVAVYRQAPGALLTESGKGVWNALVILMVVFPAIFLHEVSDRAQVYPVLKTGMQFRENIFLQ